jgi:quinol-cytochrome oxidoreductase complex cytochrome b subunit
MAAKKLAQITICPQWFFRLFYADIKPTAIEREKKIADGL